MMKNLFKKAHEMTRKMKERYPEVDYQTQFGLYVSYLFEEGKEEEEVKARVNLVGSIYVTLEDFEEIETSRGTFNLPTVVIDEEMNIKKIVDYSVWENYGKCRIYMNELGGYIEVLKDGSVEVVEKGRYAVERGMQEAVGMYLRNEKTEIVA